VRLTATIANAYGQQAPLRTESYRCFTTSSVPAATWDPRDSDWRKANGLPPLERGGRAAPQIQMPQVMIMHAFFGNIEVAANRTTRLTRSGHTGRVGFNCAASVPTFTNDLKVMSVRGYSTNPFRFFLVNQSLAFECGLQTDDRASPTTTPATAATFGGASPSTTAETTPQPSGAPTATLFTGHYEGTYTCG
jgi:hypothetical protein